jgi:hypothetical protein
MNQNETIVWLWVKTTRATPSCAQDQSNWQDYTEPEIALAHQAGET